MTAGQLRSLSLRAMPCSPVVFLGPDGTEYAVAGTRRRQRTMEAEQEDGTMRTVPDGPPILFIDLVPVRAVAPCSCAAADAVAANATPVPEKKCGFINPEPPGSQP